MHRDPQQRNMLIGMLAGGAIGLVGLFSRQYDFSNPNDISRAIGPLFVLVLLGAWIGKISGRGKTPTSLEKDDEPPADE